MKYCFTFTDIYIANLMRLSSEEKYAFGYYDVKQLIVFNVATHAY